MRHELKGALANPRVRAGRRSGWTDVLMPRQREGAAVSGAAALCGRGSKPFKSELKRTGGPGIRPGARSASKKQLSWAWTTRQNGLRARGPAAEARDRARRPRASGQIVSDAGPAVPRSGLRRARSQMQARQGPPRACAGAAAPGRRRVNRGQGPAPRRPGSCRERRKENRKVKNPWPAGLPPPHPPQKRLPGTGVVGAAALRPAGPAPPSTSSGCSTYCCKAAAWRLASCGACQFGARA